MHFHPENREAFLQVFEATKDKIRSFEGCCHLELWEDINHPGRIFTYSFWESEAALNRYRVSELFTSTWKKTKVLFSDRPQAWSIDVLSMVGEAPS